MAVVSVATPPAALGDEALLVRHTAGDRRALDELFRRYRVAAYRVAHRLLGNEADALDAVQEGFVKALTHLSGFQRRSSFKTWLLRIVTNAALDLGRARGRREARSLDASSEEIDTPRGEDPGWRLDRADTRRQLDEALAALPAAQRQTFVLHVDGDLSYREVASVLGISIGTVMSRLFYARRRLRGFLEKTLRLHDARI